MSAQTTLLVLPKLLSQITGVTQIEQTPRRMVTVYFSNGSRMRGLYPHRLTDGTDPMAVVEHLRTGGESDVDHTY